MPYIAFQTHGFSSLQPAPSGDMDVSATRLALAAAGMGATPVSLGGYARPMLELGWRILMVLSNVEPDAAATRWQKSSAYTRLDRSEKTAVSYFLGMTQACLSADLVLGFPHLVHLDAILALLNKKTAKSRPDLVSYDPATQTCSLSVEAKGRTHGRGDVAADAKAQAQSLPANLGASSTVHVASVASFEQGDHWESYLLDPPSPYAELASLIRPDVLITAYYRPLVAAMRDHGATEDDLSDDATLLVNLEPIDVTLGLPRSIVSVVEHQPLVGPLNADLVTSLGGELLEIVKELPGSLAARRRAVDPEAGLPSQAESSEPTTLGIEDRREVSDSGLVLILGPTWNERLLA